ncbi:MAG TPA: GYD domain-containing protein [Candidatus Acidoferrales bacterium]|nr:GYD domain-containing protein [Candidatus Acidoferrales bacterium]
MPHYLIQVAYNEQAWQALIKNPQDRIEAVRPAIENLGGKIKEGWFAFGDYDAVLITEMADNVTASAIAIAFAGGGACKSVRTTPLMSSAEAVEALKKASRAGYRAATAG